MEVIENKANKTLLALAIGTTVMGASVTVQAEDVSVPTTNQTETIPSETVTAETVATAKTNLDEANQNVSNQTEVVAQVQTEVNAASETVTNAEEAVSEAQAIKDQATPEVIATAEQAVTDQATVVTEAKEEVATATAEQTEKVTAVESQEAVVEEKQEVVNDAQQAVDSSQKSVDNAQAVLDGTGQAETIAEAERAEIALAESEAEVTLREGELAVAKESDRNAQILLDSLETSVRNDKVTVNTTKTALDQASAKVSETTETVKTETADVTTAKTIVDRLNSEIANHNTIVLPAGYADELRRFYLAKVAERDNASLTAVAKSGLNSNVYKSNAKDQSIPIADVNNLTLDQREELTRFTVDLLNQVREAMGTQQVFANESAIAFANEVANTSVNTGIEALNHDTTAIPTAANKYGLSGTVGQNGYENLSIGHYTVSDTLTMDDLKKAVYTTISNMLFDDGDSIWGHSTSLAGIRDLFANQPVSKYIGVDTSVINYMNYDLGRIHILGVSDKQVTDTAQFDVTANLSGRDLQAELAQAQTNLDKETAELRLATTANNEAKALELSAKQDYDKAVAELNRDQSELTRLQNRVAKTPQAITNYANAVAKRDTDKAINDKAQEALATLNADVKTKQEALANAKADLVEKQNQLAIAKADLSKGQSVLENLASSLREAEATVKEKEAVLAQAEVKAIELAQYVEDLKNAPKVLAEAQAKLAEAEKVLAEKLNILEDEQAKLKTLEAVQADVSAQHAKIVEAYKVVVKAQEEARKLAMEEKRREIENSGQTAIPVVDENGQIVDYVAEIPKSSIDSNNQEPTTHIAKYVQAALNQMVTHEETLKVVASRQTQNTYEAPLPNTGDASTATFTLMGMSFLALGVVGIRKRRLD